MLNFCYLHAQLLGRSASGQTTIAARTLFHLVSFWLLATVKYLLVVEQATVLEYCKRRSGRTHALGVPLSMYISVHAPAL